MVRLAIAGRGSMANYHAKKFSTLSYCILSACKDHNLEHARTFALNHDIPRWYDSIDDLTASHCADALSCAVVDWRHAELCVAALNGGLAVFCEKPLSRTVAEAERLAEIARSTERPTFVNFSKRNAPALHALRTVVSDGTLGEIRNVSISYKQGWVATGIWGDWRVVPRWRWRLMYDKGTTGVVGDLGSHVVDALLFVFGELSIGSNESAIDLAQADQLGLLGRFSPTDDFLGDNLPYVQITAHGAVASSIPCTIELSFISADAVDDFSLIVEGSEGRALLDLRRSRSDVELVRYGEGAAELVPGPVVLSTYEQFCNLVDTSSRLEDRGVIPDFSHGLRVQRLLDDLAPGGLPL